MLVQRRDLHSGRGDAGAGILRERALHVMHGMRHHGTSAAHKLQLLLMMMGRLLLLQLLVLVLVMLQRVRMLHVRQLLGATKGIMPWTLGHITLKRFILHSAAGDASGTAASQRCALHVTCLGTEATQYTRTKSRWILQSSVACVAWLAIPHIAGLLQYDMAIVRCAIVHLQHGGEGVRPDQINDRDEHANNEAEYAWEKGWK